jgi:thiamine biosynthesis lipoprotein
VGKVLINGEARDAQQTVQRVLFKAMGCHMSAALDAGSDAKGRLDEVPGWFARWEQHLSRFLPDSELSILNGCGGYPVQVSPILWSALKAAVEAARTTDGLVTPMVLPALKWAGYDRSFDLMGTDGTDRPGGRVLSTRSEPPAIGVYSWQELDMDARTRMVRLPSGVGLDLGGTAKGWAADKAASMLGHYAPALVDAGGDIAISGPMQNGQGWPIGVADPFEPNRQIELLIVHTGGVATSGRDYRRWKKGDSWKHHIIDPRSAQPAETNILSATVIGPSALMAEAGAKAALILGSTEGLAWLDAQPELEGLLVLDDGQIIRSKHLGRYLWAQ